MNLQFRRVIVEDRAVADEPSLLHQLGHVIS
jgi:hypothetical protein